MKEETFKFRLTGGLCNKLYCLISACHISISNNKKLVEPSFRWGKQCALFSEIYDIDYFNSVMKKYNRNQQLMLKLSEISKVKYKVKKCAKIRLFNYSNKILRRQRGSNTMSKKCMNVVVMRALRLNPKYQKISDTILNIHNKIAVHFRIEKDWKQYNKKKGKLFKKTNEVLLIDKTKLLGLIREKYKNENIFFTTGENHLELQKDFKNLGMESNYYFNTAFNYDINAAINFDICSRAKHFIGLSRSTFSNLITLKRTLEGNDENYIYNHDAVLKKRVDAGLQCDGYNAITFKTVFV
jgi:hypothetical protein